MDLISTFKPNLANPVKIGFIPDQIDQVAKQGLSDTYIVATEDGFSPLGSSNAFLENDLSVPFEEIRELANWNRFENDQVTLIAIPSRRENSLLKGLILAPCENSKCYRSFAKPLYGKPSRDFYYNVTYESIAIANQEWQSKKIAISHLSASGNFHSDIATCNAEALVHFCDEFPSAGIESLIFMGCCIDKNHLDGIQDLNNVDQIYCHQAIQLTKESKDKCIFIYLSWN